MQKIFHFINLNYECAENTNLSNFVNYQFIRHIRNSYTRTHVQEYCLLLHNFLFVCCIENNSVILTTLIQNLHQPLLSSVFLSSFSSSSKNLINNSQGRRNELFSGEARKISPFLYPRC